MREQFQENVKAGVKRPRPVGLITTKTPEVFLVDPTLTLAKDINDAKGNLIYPKGTRVNPFDTKTWPALQKANVGKFEFSKTLVFLMGMMCSKCYGPKSLQQPMTSHTPSNGF